MITQYNIVNNTTGAVLTSALVGVNPVNTGEITVKRAFYAIDVTGTAKGTTRDNTNPGTGCLVAQVKGQRVVQIRMSPIQRPITIRGTGYIQQVLGGLDVDDNLVMASLNYYTTYTKATGVTSIYVLDNAATSAANIAAGDYLLLTLKLSNGNSTIPPLGVVI